MVRQLSLDQLATTRRPGFIRPKAILILLAAALVAALLTFWLKPDHPAPTAAGVSPGQLSTCGPVHLDQVTLLFTDGRPHQQLKVATFYPWGCPSQHSHCRYRDDSRSYPDAACSPGAIYDLTGNTDPRRYNEAANREIACHTAVNSSSGQGDLRDVSPARSRGIWAEYDTQRPPGSRTGETDHLVNLSLNGSNADGNLFPQLAAGAGSFHFKDKVEVALANDVCATSGPYRITLGQAQYLVSHQWREVYDRFVHEGHIRA